MMYYEIIKGDFDMPKTKMSDAEIMALPNKNTKYILPTDTIIGETPVKPTFAHMFSAEASGVEWYTAYERPSTGEQFKVYDWDGQTKGAKQ